MKNDTINFIGLIWLFGCFIIFALIGVLLREFGNIGIIFTCLSIGPLFTSAIYLITYPINETLKNSEPEMSTKEWLRHNDPYCSGLLACYFCIRGCED